MSNEQVINMSNEQVIGLGDVVSFKWSSTGYDTGTVCQVHASGTVDVFRPFTHTSDFSCAGRYEKSLSVMCYVGTEIVKGVNPRNLKLILKSSPIR